MVVKEAFEQGNHLRALLDDLETAKRDATVIHIDSQAAYQASFGENFSKRLKHVNVALQWVREMVKSNTLARKLIETHEQAADFPIKPLPRGQKNTCCKLIRLYVGNQCKIEEKTDEEDEGNVEIYSPTAVT